MDSMKIARDKISKIAPTPNESAALYSMKTARDKIRKHIPPYLFIFPSIFIMMLMMVYPVLQTFWFSVSEVEIPSFETSFTGIENFSNTFGKEEFLQILGNTLIWVIGTVMFKFLLGFWAALTFNQSVKGGVALRVVSLLPWTVPSVVAANLWLWILQSDLGLINGFLKANGLGTLAHTWLGDTQTAMLSAMIAYTWAGFPFVMLMLLAGLQGIPKDLYEAGKIDGANPVQLFRYITLPSLKSIIFIVIILEIIAGVNAFDMLYVMTGGGPGGASEILGLYIYRLSFSEFDFGGASAVGTALLVMAAIIFIFYAPTQRTNSRAGGK